MARGWVSTMSDKLRFNLEVPVSNRGEHWIFTSYGSITVSFKLHDSVRYVPILTDVGPGMHKLPPLTGVIKVVRNGSDVGELRMEVVR
jgi:hypothetical protein